MVMAVVAADIIEEMEGKIMPRANRKGPEGMGPMTGRGLGNCAGTRTPGFENEMATPRRGRGFNRSNGRFGRGFGNGFGRGAGHDFELEDAPQERPVNQTATQVQTTLAQEVAELKAQVAALQARIQEL